MLVMTVDLRVNLRLNNDYCCMLQCDTLTDTQQCTCQTPPARLLLHRHLNYVLLLTAVNFTK